MIQLMGFIREVDGLQLYSTWSVELRNEPAVAVTFLGKLPLLDTHRLPRANLSNPAFSLIHKNGLICWHRSAAPHCSFLAGDALAMLVGWLQCVPGGCWWHGALEPPGLFASVPSRAQQSRPTCCTLLVSSPNRTRWVHQSEVPSRANCTQYLLKIYIFVHIFGKAISTV